MVLYHLVDTFTQRYYIYFKLQFYQVKFCLMFFQILEWVIFIIIIIIIKILQNIKKMIYSYVLFYMQDIFSKSYTRILLCNIVIHGTNFQRQSQISVGCIHQKKVF
eukprot:EC096396.1.p2 GENE.EC096396.1~~EC096396.1.p2  ORF type:complete len:106 (+),score=6.24 EC096396.1:328-645(+)